MVIFDLDGTLLNTIDDLATSTNYALRCAGYPEHGLSEYPAFVGNGVDKLLERALPAEYRDEETVLRIKKDFIAHYSEHNADLTRPYGGIPELLDELHGRGVVMAVTSNKYQEATLWLIRHYFGPDLFRVVLGQREGVPVKPDPAIVYDVLRQTGCSAEDALYVGDSGVDMRTAANAGIFSVGVSWGFRSRRELEENGACRLIDRPGELLDLL